MGVRAVQMCVKRHKPPCDVSHRGIPAKVPISRNIQERRMGKIKEFLQGKKTYIGAAALALVAILGWWSKSLSDENALALLSIAGGMAGLGAKSQRNAQLVLNALEELRSGHSMVLLPHQTIPISVPGTSIVGTGTPPEDRTK